MCSHKVIHSDENTDIAAYQIMAPSSKQKQFKFIKIHHPPLVCFFRSRSGEEVVMGRLGIGHFSLTHSCHLNRLPFLMPVLWSSFDGRALPASILSLNCCLSPSQYIVPSRRFSQRQEKHILKELYNAYILI